MTSIGRSWPSNGGTTSPTGSPRAGPPAARGGGAGRRGTGHCARGLHEFFHRDVEIEPVWVCPLRQRDPSVVWPLYQFDPDQTYVNVGSGRPWRYPWRRPGGRRRQPGHRTDRDRTGWPQVAVPTSYYDKDEFYDIYGGAAYWRLKGRYDPIAVCSTFTTSASDRRDSHDRNRHDVKRQGGTVKIADAFRMIVPDAPGLEFVAYDGSRPAAPTRRFVVVHSERAIQAMVSPRATGDRPGLRQRRPGFRRRCTSASDALYAHPSQASTAGQMAQLVRQFAPAALKRLPTAGRGAPVGAAPTPSTVIPTPSATTTT